MASRVSQTVLVLALAMAALLVLAAAAPGGGGDGGHKKVIIHVPYHVKKIHHTHTVYKIIKDEGHGHGGGGGGGGDTFESWGGDVGHGWH